MEEEVDPVEIFKLLVRSGHAETAVAFWAECFVWSFVPIGPESQPAYFRDGCGDMVRCLRTTYEGMFPLDKEHEGGEEEIDVGTAEEVLTGTYSEAIGKYTANEFSERKATYREAALHAIDDPDGEVFFRAIESRDNPPDLPEPI